MSSYLENVIKQFDYYKSLGDKTFTSLNFEQLNTPTKDNSNSICVIVKHMVGNMLSRWTNFLTEDGEKIDRLRDQEFEATYTSKKEFLEEWEKGWKCLFDAIKPLQTSQLEDIVYIRNQGHTITEAINRQLCHYSYHIGQIVFIGKLIQEKNWLSLSISKGESNSFNTEKFSKEKSKSHFTDNQ